MKRFISDRLKKLTNPDKETLHEEALVENYFEHIDLNDDLNYSKTEFDAAGVFGRIESDLTKQRQLTSFTIKRWAVAASIAFLCGIAAFSWQYRFDVLDYLAPIPAKEVVALNGQVKFVTLSDGTKVWLNAGTKFKYPEHFRGNNREVTVQGEAFFEVTHNAEKPFIVHSGKLSTHVLGTSFNVKAYPEENTIRVNVLTGKVGVVSPQNKTVFLTPNFEALFANDKLVRSGQADAAYLSDWRNGALVFKHAQLADVLLDLQRKFNVKMKADQNISKCSITADFTNVPLKTIISILSKLVNGKAALVEQTYYFKGKGC